MADSPFTKLKVNELQKELRDRGLDTKGKKDELIKRLQEFNAAAGTEQPGEGNEQQNGAEVADESAGTTEETIDCGGHGTASADASAENKACHEQQAPSEADASNGKRARDEGETFGGVSGSESTNNPEAEELFKKPRIEDTEEIQSQTAQAVAATEQVSDQLYEQASASEQVTAGEKRDVVPQQPAEREEQTPAEQGHPAVIASQTSEQGDGAKDTGAAAGENDVEITVQPHQPSDADPQHSNNQSEAPPPYVPPAEAPPAYPYAAPQTAYGDAYSGYAQAGYQPAYGSYPSYGAPAYGGSQSLVIEVPNDKVGLVIGKGGCTIKELEHRSGGRIQITPDSAWAGRSEPRPIKIEGTPQQLDWLKQLIAEKVNVPVESLASNATFQGYGHSSSSAPASAIPASYATPVPAPGGGVIINVPNESVGLVIGKQGSTIKQLEAQTGVKIQIAKDCPPHTPNLRPITLIGSQYSIDEARMLIQAKMENKPVPQLEGPPAYPPQQQYGYPQQQYAPPAYGQPYSYPPSQGYGYPPQQYPQQYPQNDYSQQAYGYYPPAPAPAPGGYGAPYYPPQ